MQRILKHSFFIVCVFLLGCSQKFQDTNATIKEAFWGLDDVVISAEQVSELPYASLYARINHGQRILMVLAYVEPNPKTGIEQLKWLSSDNAMIVTENGRVVKTLRLPEANLITLDGNIVAPQKTNIQWSANYSWKPNYQYDNKANVSSSVVGRETVSSLLWQEPTTIVQEQITFSKTDHSVDNFYWLDSANQVVKTSQWIVPDNLFIELEFLKFYGE